MKNVSTFILFVLLVMLGQPWDTLVSATKTIEQLQPLLVYDFKRSECHKGHCPNLGVLTESQLFRNASSTTFVAGNVGIESTAAGAFQDDDSEAEVDEDNNPPIVVSTQSLVLRNQVCPSVCGFDRWSNKRTPSVSISTPS